MSVTNVGIKLTLDGAQQAEAGLRRVQGGMEGLGRTAESVRGALGQLAGAFAGVVSVRAFAQAADAVTTLQNQLRLATGSTQAATAAYQQLFEIAQRSRVSFTELGGTFATIARATESLGLSQQQLLGVTEAIGNAIAVSGSSAAASQAALVQLSQGLASGVLRGEELNSILEQTPRLAQALADGLGVTTGQLRKMGEEGKLTAEAVIAALQSQAGTLAREVKDSVVTVGQAFTQLQNSATALVGEIDRVSGFSATLAGVAQAASESLGNIARAFRDTQSAGQSAGQQVNVFADAIAVVFETVAVAGVNVAYVIKQIGTEIGGLAAQAAAVARLDFSAAREIGRLMREDAEAARREVDALSERIWNSRRLAEQARQGVDTRAEVARYAEQAEGVRKVGVAAAEAKTKVKSLGDEFAAQREAAKGWADAYQDFARIAAQANAESLGLSKAQARLAEFLSSPAYANASEQMRQLVLEQANAAITAEQNAAAQEQQAKALQELNRSAESVEDQLQRMLDEDRALQVAAEKNITLAQAIEDVAIARLRERQAALMREGGREAEVQAIQREIDARERLAEAIGRKEAREAAADSAREAAQEWQRTAENIERSLTDALMRGFESGKDFARNLRDTVVNMFQTLVLRPVIQAIVAPVAGGITGALGLPSTANAATGGLGTVGLVSGLKSVYDTIVGGFASLGNSVASAAKDIGVWLINNTPLGKFGGSLISNAGSIGTFASYAGGAGTGLALGNLISGGYSAFGNANITNIGGTAIGAILGGPIGAAIGGAVGGVVNRLFGRKLKDYGIEGTFTSDGFTGNNYQRYKGGLFSSNKTKRSPLDPELDQALDQQFMAIKTNALELGNVLGIAGTALDGFTESIKVSFKGLNEQQIQAKLAEVLGNLSENIAATILGESGRAFAKEGETSQQTLTRLAASLQTVNAAFDTLGYTLLNASLSSADLASSLVEAFGGLDQFNAATASYYQNFYSEQERLDTAIRQLGDTFADLGLELPATKEQYRALVEAQDLTTESGRAMYAALVQLSPAFAQIAAAAVQAADSVSDAANQMAAAAVNSLQASFSAYSSLSQTMLGYGSTEFAQDLLGSLVQGFDFIGSLGGQVGAAGVIDRIEQGIANQANSARESSLQAELRVIETRRSALQEELAAAERLRDAARSLRQFVADLRVGDQSSLDLTAQRDLLAAQFSTQLTLARAGDVESFSNLQGTSRLYLDAARATATDAADYARTFALVTGKLDELGTVTETAQDTNVTTLNRQLSQLEQQTDTLNQQLDALRNTARTSSIAAELQRRLVDQARDQFRQDLQTAAEQLIATDNIAEVLEQLPPELAGILSASIASALTPALQTLASSIGSAMSAAQVAQIANQAATGNITVEQAKNTIVYDDLVRDAYASIGRTGIGEGLNQIDQAGYDYWVGVLESGAITVEDFQRNFIGAVEDYINRNPDDEYTRYLQQYLGNVPQLAVGTNYVPRDMLAVVHEGEAIVPKAYNPAANPSISMNDERMVAELKALRAEIAEMRVQSRRTADAVNGNPEAPMLVEAVV